MAIAFDAASNVAAGTGNLSWTHTPVGTPRGVVVIIVQDQAAGATDQVTAVTYGGTAMTRRTDATIIHVNGTEDGAVYCYFLGASVPTGAQTVSVTVDATGSSKRAVALTVTAANDTAIEDGATLDSASDSAPTVTLVTGAGVECFVAGAMHSGENNPANIAQGASYTQILEHDFGNACCNWARRTSNSTGGNVTMDWTNTVNEAGVGAVAVKEVAGSVTVTPGTLAMTLATFAPTVLTPRLVTPGVLALTTTRFAPAVTVGVRVTPGTAALVLATFAPVVTVGGGGVTADRLLGINFGFFRE